MYCCHFNFILINSNHDAPLHTRRSGEGLFFPVVEKFSYGPHSDSGMLLFKGLSSQILLCVLINLVTLHEPIKKDGIIERCKQKIEKLSLYIHVWAGYSPRMVQCVPHYYPVIMGEYILTGPKLWGIPNLNISLKNFCILNTSCKLWPELLLFQVQQQNQPPN